MTGADAALAIRAKPAFNVPSLLRVPSGAIPSRSDDRALNSLVIFSISPWGDRRSTGIPPTKRKNHPCGNLKSVCLPIKLSFRPHPHMTESAKIKSKFELCGSATSTNLDRFGRFPSSFHPISAKINRPMNLRIGCFC